MEREYGINGRKCSYKVIFPGGDGALGSVPAVLAWRNQLEGDILLLHEGLEFSRRFVV